MFGVLTTENEPALGYWLKALCDAGRDDLMLIFDRNGLSDRDVALFHDRTGGQLPAIDQSAYADLPMYWVRDHNGPETHHLLKLCTAALNCGTPRILKDGTLRATPFGVINAHPGRLPDYRGCSAVEWATHLGDKVTVTAHIMSSAIDTGDVILFHDAKPGASSIETRVNAHRACFEAMPMAIERLMSHDYQPVMTIGPNDGTYRKPFTQDSRSESPQP